MAARNFVYVTTPKVFPDRQRYYWEIIPAHTDTLDSPEIKTLPRSVLFGQPKKSAKHDNIPLGIMSAETMKQGVDMGNCERLCPDLHAVLTGKAAVYAGASLAVNSTWVLRSDGGDPELALNLFDIEFIGVQVTYIGSEGQLDPYTMDMELVHIGKASLESLTIPEWGAEVYLEGATIPNEQRDRYFDLVYQDDTRTMTYAKMTRPKSGGEDYRFYGFLGCWGLLEGLVQDRMELFTRGYVSLVFAFTSPFTPLSGTPGNPWEHHERYRQGFDVFTASDLPTAGDRVAFTSQAPLYWLTRIENSEGDPIGGLLDANGPWAKEYPNILDLLKDATEAAVAKGEFITQNTGGGGYWVKLHWTQVDDVDVVVPSSELSALKIAPGVKWKKGAGFVSGCDGSFVGKVDGDVDKVEVGNGTHISGVQPYSVKSPITSFPNPHADANRYFVRACGSDHISVEGSLDTDFGGTEAQKFIWGSGGAVVTHWFYFQANDVGGGPAWITSDDSLAMVTHYWADIAMGRPLTEHGSGGALDPFFILPIFVEGTNDHENGTGAFFDSFLSDHVRPALRYMQTHSDLWEACLCIGHFFGDRNHLTATFTVKRPNPFTRGKYWNGTTFIGTYGLSECFELYPSVFRDGFMDYFETADARAFIVEAESDYEAGKDSITLLFVSPDS